MAKVLGSHPDSAGVRDYLTYRGSGLARQYGDRIWLLVSLEV